MLRQIIFVMILGILTSCSTNNYDESMFILKATVKGESEEIAKNKAITTLSQNLFVNVQSNMQSSETLHNDNFSTEAQNDINISSNGYFQGLIFYNLNNIDKQTYEVSVGLTKDAYVSTLVYLKAQLTPSTINTLPKTSLRDQLAKANFLLSLVNYGRSVNIQEAQSYDINQLTSYIGELNKRVNANAIVSFLVSPNEDSHLNDIVLKVNNIQYKPYENIYLNSGKYLYTVALKGYRTKIGDIELRKDDFMKYEVYLQKQLPSVLLVELKVNNSSFLQTAEVYNLTKNVLQENQMKVVDKAQTKVLVNFSNIQANKAFESYYNMVLNGSISISGQYNKSSNFVVTYLSKDSSPIIPVDIIKNQVAKKLEKFWGSLYN